MTYLPPWQPQSINNRIGRMSPKEYHQMDFADLALLGSRNVGETCPPTSFSSVLDYSPTAGDAGFFDNSIIRRGERVSTGFANLGDEITKFSFDMKKVSSPTGTCFGRIRNAADAIVSEFGSIDVSTLTTGFTEIEFTNSESSSCAHTLIAGDRICIEYVSAPSPDLVAYDRRNSGTLANANACSFIAAWSDGGEDAPMQLWSSP